LIGNCGVAGAGVSSSQSVTKGSESTAGAAGGSGSGGGATGVGGGTGATGDRHNNNSSSSSTQTKNRYVENIFLDVGINPQQELTPYGPGLYFQLEAISVAQNRGSKNNSKSESGIFFHSLAHGGHFDQLIQRYRSPLMAKTGGLGLLLAFGVRFSLTRLQELFCLASLKSPAKAIERITTNIFDSSSLPLILVVSDTEFSSAEFILSGVEGNASKRSKESKLQAAAVELVPVQGSHSSNNQMELSPHAEIAVVLHVLHLSGLRAAQSLHQLQRDTHRINRDMMMEPVRNDNHFSLLIQIASSHGVHFIVALMHGKEIKNTITNHMEPAVRVCSLPSSSLSLSLLIRFSRYGI
jgi:hypothetical protein